MSQVEHREPAASAVQGATEVATSAIDAFRAQPGLLFLTLVNIAFLIFTYFLGNMVMQAYDAQQEQIHARYIASIQVIDRCVNEAFDLRNLREDYQRDAGKGPRP